ncbi:MAG: halocyanin domain-containing protein [Halobacteriales archaeon]
MHQADSDTTGTYRRTLLRGAAGAGASALALSGPAAAQAENGTSTPAGQPDWGNWFTGEARGGEVGNYVGDTVDRRGESEVTVAVGAQGNGGYFAFDPPALWIDPGTTVRFEWTGRGSAHNVVGESGPADLDSGDPVSEPGVHYEYTFEETGINTYYCLPHLALGMKGGIAVGDDIPMAAPGGPSADGGEGLTLPGGTVGGLLMTALAGTAGLAIVAALAGEFAGWRRQRAAARTAAAGEADEAWTGVVEEIGHDEFDPTGTAWLIALYFLVLLVMWVYVYFVEFLGGGPTVIG